MNWRSASSACYLLCCAHASEGTHARFVRIVHFLYSRTPCVTTGSTAQFLWGARCWPTGGPRSSSARWCSAAPVSTRSSAACPASRARCSRSGSGISSCAGCCVESHSPSGRGNEYHLTDAGRDLEPVIMAIGEWAVRWLFAEPLPAEVDPDHAHVVAPSTRRHRPLAGPARRRRVRLHRRRRHDAVAGARPWRAVGVREGSRVSTSISSSPPIRSR